MTDFTLQESAVPLNEKKYESIDKAYCLGETPLFSVFEVHHHHVADARVALTKQAVEIMKSRQKFTECALFFFVPKNSDSFRISLVTVDWADNKKASNPRRFSFLVGENQKIHTASQQLSSSVRSREDLLKRFSIEVVNDEFYKKISEHFENLLKQIDYPNVCEQAKQEEAKRNFAVRLIGRLIFCWFLKKKLRQDGSPLIPESLLSSCIVGEYDNYYHDVLEPLFFETLNKPFEDRIAKCKMGDFQNIPFLNGGLFEAHLPEDGYKYDQTTETCFLGASVTIQNNWFIKFFETLETYNFTIDENTSTDIDLAVDPEMLGRIFENLLASINPETKESVRKATGSYYTPREIVDYMVTQSLKQYLYTKTDISHGVIDSLFDFEDRTISDADKQKIQKALLTIKVLDPAVGSGAFPMGMLQKMLAVLNRMGLSTQNHINKTLDYQHKLDIIQHCIYGVDIQPMAIEICRLRFFLTLIVDESSDNPQPLPNLNFNFACANSLVALDNNDLLALKQEKEKLDKTIKEKESLLSCGGQMLWNLSKEVQSKIRVQKDEIKKLTDKQKALVKKINAINVVSFLNGDNYIEQLRAYRKEFFTSSGKEKEELKQKFLETQEEMFHALKANDWGNDKVLKLQTWKPFDTVSTPWFDPFWMLGVEDGFDIVIANPPYIGEKGHKDIFAPVKKSVLKQFYLGKMDFSYFFFHLALNLLKNHGICSFITENSYITATGGRSLRKDFKDRASILNLVNFNELKIFKSALGQYNMITLLQKTNNQNVYCDIADVHRKGFLTSSIFNGIISKIDNQVFYYSALQKNLYEGAEYYIRICTEDVHNPLSNLLNKIQKGNEELGAICNVNQGIVTGADFLTEQHIRKYGIKKTLSSGIFVLDISEKNVFKMSGEYLKSFYKNSDIRKYFTSYQQQKYIIYFSRNENPEKLKEIQAHLFPYKGILESRREVSNGRIRWFDLWWPRQQGIFEEEKIVVPQRSSENTFGYNESEWYAASDVFFVTKAKKGYELKYILALLNSKLYYVWLYNRGKRKGEILELIATPLSEIPIKKTEDKIQQQFIAIVDKILAITQTDDYLSNKDKQNRVKAYQDEIDQLVYKLYGLTEEEIKVVEESQPKKLKN